MHVGTDSVNVGHIPEWNLSFSTAMTGIGL